MFITSVIARRSRFVLVALAAAGVLDLQLLACSSTPQGSDVGTSDNAGSSHATNGSSKKDDSSSNTAGSSTAGSNDSASPTSATVDADAGVDPDAGAAPDAATPTPAPPPPLPCSAPGAGVYASVDASSAWRYSTTLEVADGFQARGLAFRLAPDATAEAHATLYLSKSEQFGDYLVTTVPSEGAAAGYGPLAVIGTVYLQPLEGTVPLTRYYQTSPALRHQVSVDGQPGGWDPEPPRGYVCPR
jgi:hypothetical protein